MPASTSDADDSRRRLARRRALRAAIAVTTLIGAPMSLGCAASVTAVSPAPADVWTADAQAADVSAVDAPTARDVSVRDAVDVADAGCRGLESGSPAWEECCNAASLDGGWDPACGAWGPFMPPESADVSSRGSLAVVTS